MSSAYNTDSLSTTSLLKSGRQYSKSGIGGAGNIRLSSDFLAVPSAPRMIPTRSTGIFLTGIGGIGNARTFEERASIPHDEDLARRTARKLSIASVYHHGIGGAGNRSSSVDSSRSSSVASENFLDVAMGGQSGADRMKGRVSKYFSSRAERKLELDEPDMEKCDSWISK